jgi:O-antigen/teichoic acid export membrane protein
VSSGSPLRRSYFATLATNGGLALLGLATGVLAARLLGPAGRGELAAIQNVSVQLMVLASLGIPNALAYFVSRDTDSARGLLATGLLIALAASLPAMALGWALMPLVLSGQSQPTVDAARAYLVYVPLAMVASFPHWVLQGASRFRDWNLLRLLPAAAWLGVLLLAFAERPSAPELARRYLAAYALAVPAGWWALARATRGSWAPLRRTRPLLRYGAPSVLGSVPAELNVRLDQILMAALLPAEQLGLYAVGVAWSGAVTGPLLAALGSVLLPRVASDPTTAVARYVRLSALAAALATAALLVATPFALPLLFGEAFGGAAPATLLLVVAAGVAGLGRVLEEVMRGLGEPDWPMGAQLAGLAATLVLLALLLQRYGGVGAALASLGSYSLALAVLLVGVRRRLAIRLGALLPRAADLRELTILLRSALGRDPRIRN